MSDNDDMPPSSKSRNLHSSETSRTVSQFCNQFHKRTNEIEDKNFINYRSNNCKVLSNSNKKNVINRDNIHVLDDNSENLDNRFQILDRSNECQTSQYQTKTKKTTVDDSAINIKPQLNLTTSPSRTTPSPTAKTYNKQPPLQNNEFISRHQRRASTLSVSVSSIASSYDENFTPDMHHCNGSPVISIRSISSIIITSDSDSDINSDIEGVHENYVIKKLGTQVTFSPNDPEIPNINSGHTVLNQKIIANSSESPLNTLATLAAVGDRIGAAQALGPVPSSSTVAQRPQIGSIALNNSSDVTFGDKHFYEGPVTIQQFLIDGSEKWKEANKNKNPTFGNENVEGCTNDAKTISSSLEKSRKLYENILQRKKFVIPCLLAFMALLIVATILGSKMFNDNKTQDNVGGGYVLRIVPRDGWLSQPPVNPWVKLKLPIERVIVIPTRTSECETQAECTYTVRITQTYNIESQQQDDIIYNFLIGGDGNVYEGRGWDNRGSVVKGFNDDSISFAFIGSFKKQPPSYKQLNVTQLLLQEGVRLKKLTANYKIVGANKLDPTSVETTADALYKSFENWPHWSDE